MDPRFWITLVFLFATRAAIIPKQDEYGVIISKDCSSQMRDRIEQALPEVHEMLRTVEVHLGQLRDFVSLSPSEITGNDESNFGSMRNVFREFMYRPLQRTQDPNEASDDVRRRDIQAVDTVRNLARAMVSLLDKMHEVKPDDSDLRFVCSLNWLIPLPGVVNTYWENKNYFGPPKTVEIKDEAKKERAGTRTEVITYNGPRNAVIYLNTAFEHDWITKFSPPRELFNIYLRGTTPDKGQDEYLKMAKWPSRTLRYNTWWLYQLIPNHLSATLIYALSQVDELGQRYDSARLFTQDCMEEIDCPHRPSDWICVKKLAETPEKSLRSPLNFQYLVVALYLDQWDWSEGYNRPTKINTVRVTNPQSPGHVGQPESQIPETSGSRAGSGSSDEDPGTEQDPWYFADPDALPSSDMFPNLFDSAAPKGPHVFDPGSCGKGALDDGLYEPASSLGQQNQQTAQIGEQQESEVGTQAGQGGDQPEQKNQQAASAVKQEGTPLGAQPVSAGDTDAEGDSAMDSAGAQTDSSGDTEVGGDNAAASLDSFEGKTDDSGGEEDRAPETSTSSEDESDNSGEDGGDTTNVPGAQAAPAPAPSGDTDSEGSSSKDSEPWDEDELDESGDPTGDQFFYGDAP